MYLMLYINVKGIVRVLRKTPKRTEKEQKKTYYNGCKKRNSGQKRFLENHD
jgi:hypothetical protein